MRQITRIVFLAFPLYLFCHAISRQRTRTITFSRISLTSNPSTSLVSMSRGKGVLHCMSACTEMSGLLCRGFRVQNNNCYLYRGVVEGIPRSGPSSDKIFKVRSFNLPSCTSHPGFRVIFNHAATYCLYFDMDKVKYDKAVSHCHGLGANVFFMNNSDTVKMVSNEISVIRGNNLWKDFWVGARSEGNTRNFIGERPGQVIVESSDFWATGNPDNSGPGENCAAATHDFKLNDVSCSSEKRYVCELYGIF